MNALKYFKEKANDYHVIAAGSLLGTLLAQPKSYPVGMVNLLDITPLTFDEFLNATDESLFAYYQSITKEQQIEELFHLCGVILFDCCMNNRIAVLCEEFLRKELAVFFAVCFVFIAKLGIDCGESVREGVGVIRDRAALCRSL